MKKSRASDAFDGGATNRKEARERVQILDPLRGLASLAVAWFHLSHEMGFTRVGTSLYKSGAYSWIGVEVFFVISGFVIPFALETSRYRLKAYGRFLLRRIVRLDPPYLVSILLSLSLAAYYSKVTNTPFAFSTPQILLHLGYLNVFFKYDWINPIFWTLAVEVQYYLLIGLAFPLLLNRHVFWGLIAPLCVALTFLLPFDGYIFRYLPFFLLGIAAFQYRVRVLERWHFLLSVGALAMVAWISIGWQPTLAALFSALAIGFVRSAPRPFVAAGSISYSLYLIHGPIGYTVGSAMQRRLPGLPPIGIVLLSLAVCILSAWVLYRLVELPSLRLSKRIRYRPRPDGVTALSEGRQGCSP